MVDYHQDQKTRENFPRVLGQALEGREEMITFGQRWDDHGPSELPPFIPGHCPRTMNCSFF
jgi:hypothetical protein